MERSWQEYEITPEAGLQRRWFKYKSYDLLLWLDLNKTISRFQFSYPVQINSPSAAQGYTLREGVFEYSAAQGCRQLMVSDDQSDFPTPKLLINDADSKGLKEALDVLQKVSLGLPTEYFKTLVQKIQLFVS